MRGVKTKAKSRWKRLPIFLVLLVVFSFLLNSVFNVYNKKKEAEEALARMWEEVDTLKERENFLQNSLQKLSTPEGIEFEIRKKLNVAEAGEAVAIIVKEEEGTPESGVSTTSAWQKIKAFFYAIIE